MSLDIITLTLGPMENNTYLAADLDTREAVIIDPSFGSETVLSEASARGWKLTGIWLTHAHFDHIAGIQTLVNALQPGALPVGLHPADLPLYQESGGARAFGLHLPPGPEPSILFKHKQALSVGWQTLRVLHTPGHTPGHVVFYSAETGAALCGDLIFYHSVGRTDLPGGDFDALLESIRSQIFTLPPATRLLCGHGPETTVAEEAQNNPFF